MTRIARDHDHAFYVTGSNIHNDHFEEYGPFPGLPYLTYEFLRDGEGTHIFIYEDPTIGDDVLHAQETDHDCQVEDGPDHWHDQEGAYRRDGWRRCFDDHPAEAGQGGRFGIPHSAFWTDLGFRIVPAGDLEFDRRTYNWHPDQDVREGTTHRSNPAPVPVGVDGDPFREPVH